MGTKHLWTVIGRGTSPQGQEVSLVVNNVPGETMPEAAQAAIRRWESRGVSDYQPHKARKFEPFIAANDWGPIAPAPAMECAA